MFFSSRIDEIARYNADHLQNPKNKNSPMDYVFNETVFNTAFYSQTTPHQHFVDKQTGKRIGQKLWTNEMHQFAKVKLQENPEVKKHFKINYGTYVLLVIAVFGAYMIFKEQRENKTAMDIKNTQKEQTIIPDQLVPGTVLYGHYTRYEPGERIPKEARFTWAKVVEANGDTYQLALGKEFSQQAIDEQSLNSTDFEAETIALKIESNNGYQCILKNDEKTHEFSATKRKEGTP